ncbi:MAG TPA: sigma-70 family RNA polymerase sigma factor [Bryobacteraceae bacterium]|nr:sigma-70 family RNA polymerase sigma factor [Bryobacteraceae bacterium]
MSLLKTVKPEGAGIEADGNPTDPSWPDLVQRIQMGDPSGMEDLYHIFSKGIRFFLCRQLGPQDLDDKVHDVFLIVAQAIRKGDLREPERLMGYVRTVVRRQIAAHIDDAVQTRRKQADLDAGMVLSDRRPDPEHAAINRQNLDLALRILNSIPKRDREILIRFYLQEQSAERICREMKLTSTQFRLIKSRAKARFGELGKRRMSLRSGFRR